MVCLPMINSEGSSSRYSERFKGDVGVPRWPMVIKECVREVAKYDWWESTNEAVKAQSCGANSKRSPNRHSERCSGNIGVPMVNGH